MRATEITLNGDGTFLPITATGPFHRVRVRELGLSPVGLIAEFPDDGFSNQVNYATGVVIERIGNGYHGVLGYAANAISGKAPASATVYMKVKASDGTAKKVLLEEFEGGELP